MRRVPASLLLRRHVLSSLLFPIFPRPAAMLPCWVDCGRSTIAQHRVGNPYCLQDRFLLGVTRTSTTCHLSQTATDGPSDPRGSGKFEPLPSWVNQCFNRTAPSSSPPSDPVPSGLGPVQNTSSESNGQAPVQIESSLNPRLIEF